MIGADTHSKTVGYVLWIFGFMGAHRFYYGRPISGTLYFFTLGLLFVGWIVDLFLIPAMDDEADRRFFSGGIQLHGGVDSVDIFRCVRHSSHVHGQMAYWRSLSADAADCC